MPSVQSVLRRACWLAAWLFAAGAAVAQPASASQAQAGRPAPQLDQLAESWTDFVVGMPRQWALDATLQPQATAWSTELRPALVLAVRRWLEELRAAQPEAAAEILFVPLMARMNNELVTWLVSAPEPEHEAIEWRLAQQPDYCRERSNLHGRGWALLAERLLFLQPLQGAEREAAIAAERRRWQRWLSGGLAEAGSPTPSPQLQAFQAAERLRAGDTDFPQPMVPWLSRQMLGERAPEPYRALDQECALMQWWLANQVQGGALSPKQALRLFRHGTLPAVENLLLLPPHLREHAHSASSSNYPPIAQYFEVTGTTRVAFSQDAAGQVRDVQVTQRRLQVPGLTAGQPPVAFEQTLDRAAFARVRAMRLEKPQAEKLRDGLVRTEVELVWSLQ